MPNLVSLKSTNLEEKLFNLHINQTLNETNITMKLHIGMVRTENLPNTYTTLLDVLPSIFESKCFNDRGFSFSKEVLNTEIGHLFEHILIEYLTQLKFLYNNKNSIYSGITSWNWHKEEHGVFHIKIDAGSNEEYIFEEALEKSKNLLTRILEDHLQYIN